MTTAQVATGSSSATKKCKTCGVAKPPDQFNKSSLSKDGRTSRCRECTNTRKREQTERDQLQEAIAKSLVASHADKSSDELVIAMWDAGLPFLAIAQAVVGHTEKTVENVVVNHLADSVEPRWREVERQRTVLRLDTLFHEARAKGDLREARLTEMDKLKAIGVVQQGGAAMTFNFNNQNNVIEARLEDWMRRNDLTQPIVPKQLTHSSVDPPVAADTLEEAAS